MMNNIIGFAFLALSSRSLSDCDGDKFGYNGGIPLLFIYENGTFNLKEGQPMTLSLPAGLYTGKSVFFKHFKQYYFRHKCYLTKRNWSYRRIYQHFK